MISLPAITRLSIRQILLIAVVLRLLAAFFGQGYLFHDDHFFVAELAWNWKEGVPDWLSRGAPETSVLSLLYPGFHYLLFIVLEYFGLTEPNGVMLVVRLLHGIFSLLTVYYAYLLTRRLTGNEDLARITGFLFAIFWLFPLLSVHNVKEFVCIPFLLMGSYFISAAPLRFRDLALGALFFSLAVCLRIQTVWIPFGIGLGLLLQRSDLKNGVVFGILFLAGFFLTQGLFDSLYYGDPLHSTVAYLLYNTSSANISQYPTGPSYQYLGTVTAAVLGPPVLLFGWGYVRSFRLSRPALMLFIGSLLFFIYHSFYPGKQERFILPFLPFFLLLGTIGFHDYYQNSRRRWLRKLTRVLVIWFMFINLAGLAVLTFSYSKRSRVEAMNYLREKGDVTNIIIESPGRPPFLPLFYLQKDLKYFPLGASDDINQFRAHMNSSRLPQPNYLIMAGDRDLEKRLGRIRSIYPGLQHEADIGPGLLDNIAYRLNPAHNVNEVWKIYRLE